MEETMNDKVVCPYATRRCNEDCKAFVYPDTCMVMETEIRTVNTLHNIEDLLKIAGGGNGIKTS
jgi:hypothetical protein